jgi:glycosyltransferase involved in cell wall biosynthesis
VSISVALCTYNGTRFIEEQLASVLDQSLPVTEIVLSDDASVDDTVSLVRAAVAAHNAEFPETPVVLRVMQNPVALGVVKNFEQAAGACTGDVIALCDQDDIWSPRHIERLVQEFVGRPQLLLVHSNAALIEEDGTPMDLSLFDALEISNTTKRAINTGRGFRELLHRNVVTGATTMVRRELVAIAAPFPELWIHDEWLAMVAGAIGDFGLVDEELLSYRQHPGNHIGAVKLSLRGKISKLREPRAERNRNLAARAGVLLERLTEMSDRVSPACIFDAQANLKHQAFRRSLPAPRWRRVVPVLVHGAILDYSRYGRGGVDMLRDIVQPAD